MGIHLSVWTVRHQIRAGDIGCITHLHGVLYAEEFGYDQSFKAYVAEGLGRFVQSFRPDRDRLWVAEAGGKIIGSIAIVSVSEKEAQLRWFLVHPKYRGRGLGRLLIEEAVGFCGECGYGNVFLLTTSELGVARHLYTSVGFRKTEQTTHRIWGKEVTEERYDLGLRAE